MLGNSWKFLQHYGEKHWQRLQTNGQYARFNIFFCLLVFALLVLVRAHISLSEVRGILGSLQLLISVYLCVSIQKQGYQIAVAMNGIAGTVAALQTFFSADVSALSGIAFPLCTIITLRNY